MNPCPSREQLERLLADQLSALERPQVEAHLEQCPHCEQVLEQLTADSVLQPRHSPEKSPEPVAPSPPRQQIGDYRILREIGRGGMGIVYEAEQISLGRRVALKVLPQQVMQDDRALERFRREARAAAQLHHTNIVPVFEVGQEGAVWYYAMQLIAGQPLDQVIGELRRFRSPSRRAQSLPRVANDQTETAAQPAPSLNDVSRSLVTGEFRPELDQPPAASQDAAPVNSLTEASGPARPGPANRQTRKQGGQESGKTGSLSSSSLPISRSGRDESRRYFLSVARIGQQAAQGLAHAHARGIIHRDIKPSNLLLDLAGVVWITDFGLAKMEEDGLTATGDILGTLRYMAPERFSGRCDASADIYALGVTLYELLVLQPAFDATDRLELLKQVQAQDVRRPRSLDASIPLDLETIVLTAMDREPQRRYRTADDLAADLERFQRGEPIRARRVGELERAWKWAKRYPVVASLLATVAILLVVGTAVSLNFAFQAHGEEQKARAAQAIAEGKEKEAARQLALAHCNRGLVLCEQGEAAVGLHWLLESLKTAPAEDADFLHLVRLNLAAWMDAAPALRHLLRHESLSHAAYSPDGKVLVTTGQDKKARVWDAATGELIRTLDHSEGLLGVGFSPDGKTLFLGWEGCQGRDRSSGVYCWDPATGQLLETFQTSGAISSLVVTSDGKKLITGTDNGLSPGGTHLGEVRAWDAQTRQPIGPAVAQPGRVTNVYLLPDGKTVLARCGNHWGGNNYQLTDLSTGQREGQMFTTRAGESVVLPGSQTLVYHDARWHLAPGLTLHWREARTGQERRANVANRRAGNTNLNVASPDGQSLWFGTSVGRLDWRDSTTGRLLSSFLSHEGLARTLCSNGLQIAVTSGGPTLRIWEVPRIVLPNSEPDTEALDPLGKGRVALDGFTRFAFSPDRTRAVVAGWGFGDSLRGGTARLVDTATGRPIGPPMRHPWEAVRCVAFSPDGKVLATGANPPQVGGAVWLWDGRTGTEWRLAGGGTQGPGTAPAPQVVLPMTNYPSTLAFSPDGKLLATGDYHQAVRLWDVATGQPVGKPLLTPNVIFSLAFSPDGKILAAGTANDRQGPAATHLWEVATGQPLGPPLLSPGNGRVNRLKFSPDGRTLLSFTVEGRVSRWEPATGALLGELPIEMLGTFPITQAQGGITFSPDGRTFLTGNMDGQARLWEAATGQPIRGATFAHPAAITAAAYRPDGRLAVIGCADGIVRLWDLATFQPVGPPLAMPQLILGVTFTPDGRSVVAVDQTGHSRSWATPTPVQEDVDRLALQLQVRTGLRLEAGTEVSLLKAQEWEQRRQELIRLEGSADSACRFRMSAADYHYGLAQDAEEDGNTFAAVWQLDRLIALGPDDWFLYARRGRAHSAAGQLEFAAADYEQARKRQAGDGLVDWYRLRVTECRTAKEFATALWYLDQVRPLRPGDWTVFRDRADLLAGLGKKEESDAALERAVEMGGDVQVALRLVEVYARKGQWQRAASLLGEKQQKGPAPLSLNLAYQHAIALLQAGDAVGYQKLCAGLLQATAQAKLSPSAANSVAWATALGPAGVADYEPVIRYAEQAVAAARGAQSKHLVLNTLGAVLYRAGRHQEAIQRLEEAVTLDQGKGVIQDWLFLAMANHQLHKPEEARKWLAKAVPPKGNNNFWEKAEVELLHCEAEALIGASKP